jgi:Ni/Co efflux regulator RcnB
MKKFVFAVVIIIIAVTQFLAAQAQTQDALIGQITSAEARRHGGGAGQREEDRIHHHHQRR